MYYADLRKYDTSNWSGINSTLFVSGCKHCCEGCWNKEAWNFKYGKPYTEEVEDLFISYIKDEHVVGACILGGEPFQQDLDIIFHLVKRIKEETDKPIHMWSGYTWEELIKRDKCVDILLWVDTLVDGRFELNKRDLTLKHKGSTNQREIDVQKSLKQGEIVLINP